MKSPSKFVETIVAICTSSGEGALGIIRVSGPLVLEIAQKIFCDKNSRLKNNFESYRVNYGFIVDPKTFEKIDEVFLTFMSAPQTFTKEDIVEISGHGGVVSLQNILNIILEQGVRLAGPGEFTQRAFLNGRIDLTQAEAVIDIIRAKNESGLKAAVKQLEGKLGRQIKSLRTELLDLCAQLEAGIDFSEEELELIPSSVIQTRLTEIIKKISSLIDNFSQGKILREGIHVAIIGKPNVGKSSLLNALIGEDRAIVTSIPGTTRDLIKEEITVNGLVLNIIDTAGLRSTNEEIESLGIEKTYATINRADLILLIFDGSEKLTGDDFEVIKKTVHKKVIYIINKSDLLSPEKDYKELKGPGRSLLEISAKYGQGIEDLKKEISRIIGQDADLYVDTALINRLRHKESLVKVKVNLENALQTTQNNLSFEFVAVDLRAGLEALGEITGETFSEEILNKIFSEFCIGK